MAISHSNTRRGGATHLTLPQLFVAYLIGDVAARKFQTIYNSLAAPLRESRPDQSYETGGTGVFPYRWDEFYMAADATTINENGKHWQYAVPRRVVQMLVSLSYHAPYFVSDDGSLALTRSNSAIDHSARRFCIRPRQQSDL